MNLRKKKRKKKKEKEKKRRKKEKRKEKRQKRKENREKRQRQKRRVLFAELQQLRWAINSNSTVASHYYRRIPHRSCSSNKLRSVSCRCGHGVLLLRDVLCLTHLSSGLGCSTAPRRWPRLPTPRVCSWPHAKPASFLRLLLLLQHLSRMQRLIQSLHSRRFHHSSRFHCSIV